VPSDIGYRQAREAMIRFFQARGSNASEAESQAMGWIGQTLQHQVALLAYIDVFWILAVIAALMIPLALMIGRIDLRAPARAH
jgi:MFS transporter, DHA2 family, multidrug resistance protein